MYCDIVAGVKLTEVVPPIIMLSRVKSMGIAILIDLVAGGGFSLPSSSVAMMLEFPSLSSGAGGFVEPTLNSPSMALDSVFLTLAHLVTIGRSRCRLNRL